MGSDSFVKLINWIIHFNYTVEDKYDNALLEGLLGKIIKLENDSEKTADIHNVIARIRKHGTTCNYKGSLPIKLLLDIRQEKIRQVIIAQAIPRQDLGKRQRKIKRKTERIIVSTRSGKHYIVSTSVEKIYLMLGTPDSIHKIQRFVYAALSQLIKNKSSQTPIEALYQQIMVIINSRWRFWWEYKHRSIFYSLANLALAKKNHHCIDVFQIINNASYEKSQKDKVLKQLEDNHYYLMRNQQPSMFKKSFVTDDATIIKPPYGNIYQECGKPDLHNKNALLTHSMFQIMTEASAKRKKNISHFYYDGLQQRSQTILYIYLKACRFVTDESIKYKQIVIFEPQTQQFLWMIIATCTHGNRLGDSGSFIFYWAYHEKHFPFPSGFRLEKIELVGHENFLRYFPKTFYDRGSQSRDKKIKTIKLMPIEAVFKQYNNNVSQLNYLKCAMLRIEDSAVATLSLPDSQQMVVNFSCGIKNVTLTQGRSLALLTMLYNKKKIQLLSKHIFY
ncbi:MAG: hypothetical protein JKY13_03895 [Gammaproteobacteria bacterium]|nr:hypothetical protein [Gammaproteobacteria bacterium]